MSAQRGPAFIANNLLGQPYATVSVLTAYATAEPAELKAIRLQTEEPTEVARITTVDPLATRWQAEFTKGVAREVTGIALVSVPNLSPWGKYRFTVGEPTYQDLAPTSIVGTPVNFGSGIPADVDEAVFTPDDKWMTPFLGDYWNVELGGFPTPTTAPIHGDSRCWVSLFVRYTGGSPTNAYPAAGVTLKQGGSVVANLGTRAITSAEGQILVFPFDAADLPTASGAGLSVLCEFDSSNVVAELGACRIAVERVAPAQASPWINSPTYGLDEEEPALLAPFTDLQYFPTTPWTITANDLLFVQIQDDQTEHDPDNGTVGAIDFFRIPINNVDTRFTRGFVDAGVFVTGTALILGKRPNGGDSPGFLQYNTPTGHIEIVGFEGETEGGQTYGSDAFRHKAIELNLCVTRDELLEVQGIVSRKGHSGALFFAAEPDIPVQRQQFNSGWFTIASMSIPTRLPGSAYDEGDGTMLFTFSLELKGKL